MYAVSKHVAVHPQAASTLNFHSDRVSALTVRAHNNLTHGNDALPHNMHISSENMFRCCLGIPQPLSAFAGRIWRLLRALNLADTLRCSDVGSCTVVGSCAVVFVV